MTGSRKLYVKSFGCQMNVYNSQRMADTLAPEGYVETGDGRRRRSHHPQHLPYPREGGGEGLFRARPHAPLERGGGRGRPQRAHRGRRLRRAGRRRGDHPPGAGGRSRRRIAELPSPARSDRARRARRQRRRYRVSGRTTSSIILPRRARRARARAASPLSSRCRRAATSSARFASCLTRAARKSRGRSTKSLPRSSGLPTPAFAKSRSSGRTSMPITAPDRMGGRGRWRNCWIVSRNCPASSGCAIRPAIRSTWLTI